MAQAKFQQQMLHKKEARVAEDLSGTGTKTTNWIMSHITFIRAM